MKKSTASLMAMTMMVTSVMGPAVNVLGAVSNTQVYDFEQELEGWTGRGTAAVAIDKTQAKQGKASAYVSGRTANWNGISKDMGKILQKGSSYTIGAWVKYEEGSATESISLTLEEEVSGQTEKQYVQVAQNSSVKKGEWTYVEGKITLDADVSSAVLYLEAASPTLSFYVDELTIKGDQQMQENMIQQDIPSLKEVYKDYFKIGTAISTQDISEIDKQAILKHFNSFTCGNEMKPDFLLDYDATVAYMAANKGDQIHPQVNFKAADSSLKFAAENHIAVRGHVFTWHSQTPNWFFKENFSKDPAAPNASKEVMLQRLENYIKIVFETVEKEYPDVEFYAWDVVNEAINPSTADGMRLPAEVAGITGDDGNNENEGRSMWMTTVGEEFIEKAFEYARKYAPEGVKLTYNDYNECDPEKAEMIYKLCKKLADQGNLDVIGMQGHYNMNSPSIDQLEAAIRKYASLGVEIQITELDVMQEDGSEEGMIKQGYRYKEIFDKLKQLSEEPDIHIGACVLWGTDDGNSWRSQSKPLLFDEKYQAKPAYWGAVDASKLPAIKNEIKAQKMGSDQKVTWRIQGANALKTEAGKVLAQMKVAWDEQNLYMQVTPGSSLQGKEGTIQVWVDEANDGGSDLQKDDLVKTYSLKEGEMIQIPIQGGLKEGQSLGLEAAVKVDGQVAVWNSQQNVTAAAPSNFGKITLQKADGYLSASKGTPIIDGKTDKIWENAQSISVNQMTVGKSGATATAKALWDDEHIYVLVDVKDHLLSKKSANAHEQDSVEVFIDEDHAKTKTYGQGDVQYRVNFANEHSINGVSDPESFQSAATLTEEGYQIEMALPYRIENFKEGQILGFEVQVNNDENGNGIRDSVANWSDLTGNGWSSTENFGALELTK